MTSTFFIIISTSIIAEVSGLLYPRPQPINPSEVTLSFHHLNETAIRLNASAHPLGFTGQNSYSYSTNVIYITNTKYRTLSQNIDEVIEMDPEIEMQTISHLPFGEESEMVHQSPEMVDQSTEAMTPYASDIGATIGEAVGFFDSPELKVFAFSSQIAGDLSMMATWALFIQSKLSAQHQLLDQIMQQLNTIENKINDLSTEVHNAVDSIEKYLDWQKLSDFAVLTQEQFGCMMISTNHSAFSTDQTLSVCCPKNQHNPNLTECQLETAELMLSEVGIDLNSVHEQMFTLLTGSSAYGGGGDTNQGYLYIYAQVLWNQYTAKTINSGGVHEPTKFDTLNWYSDYTQLIIHSRLLLTRSARLLVWATCLLNSDDACYQHWEIRSNDIVSFRSYANYAVPDVISLVHQKAAINMTRSCNVLRKSTGKIVNISCANYTVQKSIPQRVFINVGGSSNCMCLHELNKVCIENDCEGNHGGWRSTSGYTIGGIKGYGLDPSVCDNSYPIIHFGFEDSVGIWSTTNNVIKPDSKLDLNAYDINNSLSVIWDDKQYEALAVFAESASGVSNTLLTTAGECVNFMNKVRTEGKPQFGSHELPMAWCPTLNGQNNFGISWIYSEHMENFDMVINDRSFHALLQIENIYCKSDALDYKIRILTYSVESGRNWQFATRECTVGGSECTNGHGCSHFVIASFVAHSNVANCVNYNVYAYADEDSDNYSVTIIIGIVVSVFIVVIGFFIVGFVIHKKRKVKYDDTYSEMADFQNS